MTTYFTDRGIARRTLRWLQKARSRRAKATHLDTFSDHMRRDIGIPRDPFDRIHITALEAAARMSSIST